MNAYRIITIVWIAFFAIPTGYAEDQTDKKARYTTAAGCLRCHQGGEQRDEEAESQERSAKTESGDTKS